MVLGWYVSFCDFLVASRVPSSSEPKGLCFVDLAKDIDAV